MTKVFIFTGGIIVLFITIHFVLNVAGNLNAHAGGILLIILLVVLPFFIISYFVMKAAVRDGYMEARRMTDTDGDNLLRHHIRQAVKDVLAEKNEK